MNLEMLDMYCASLIYEIEASRDRDRILGSDYANGLPALPRRRTERAILATFALVLRNLVSRVTGPSTTLRHRQVE
jgi:hypothetical protein